MQHNGKENPSLLFDNTLALEPPGKSNSRYVHSSPENVGPPDHSRDAECRTEEEASVVPIALDACQAVRQLLPMVSHNMHRWSVHEVERVRQLAKVLYDK